MFHYKMTSEHKDKSTKADNESRMIFELHRLNIIRTREAAAKSSRSYKKGERDSWAGKGSKVRRKSRRKS